MKRERRGPLEAPEARGGWCARQCGAGGRCEERGAQRELGRSDRIPITGAPRRGCDKLPVKGSKGPRCARRRFNDLGAGLRRRGSRAALPKSFPSGSGAPPRPFGSKREPSGTKRRVSLERAAPGGVALGSPEVRDPRGELAGVLARALGGCGGGARPRSPPPPHFRTTSVRSAGPTLARDGKPSSGQGTKSPDCPPIPLHPTDVPPRRASRVSPGNRLDRGDAPAGQD